MKEYKLFYSWQSDRKDVKSIIKEAVRVAKEKLYKEGIELLVDEDTRNRAGNRDIIMEVLDKIKHCDIFLADVTPVITLTDETGEELPKLMPNCNVMYEYGFAQHCKGEGRIITLAKLEKGQYKQCMPFDINHNTLTTFKTLNDLNRLDDWIMAIIKRVDDDRANDVPDYACKLVFLGSSSHQFTIAPQYVKTTYVQENGGLEVVVENEAETETTQPTQAEINLTAIMDKLARPTFQGSGIPIIRQKINRAYCPIALVFNNQGAKALENCKISIYADDNRVEFDEKNYESMPPFNLGKTKNIFLSNPSVFREIPVINPHDIETLSIFYVHVPHNLEEFKLLWECGSKTYRDNGELEIKVKPQIIRQTKVSNDKAGTVEVSDLIVNERI